VCKLVLPRRNCVSYVLPKRLSEKLAQAGRAALQLSLLTAFSLCASSWLRQTARAQTAAPVDVTTWRYDTTHAGQNTQELALTPSNVNPASFGKLFSLSVDGYVYAQPLYVNGLTMKDGLVHNVLFVATQHDSLYAFDADTNGGANAQPLWQASMTSPAYGAAAGATTVPNSDVGTADIVPEIGIVGTPAINLATNTLYVVSKTKENGAYVQRLHAINLITGAEQPNSPTAIQATVAGTGNGSSGGQLAFSPLWQMNRGALDYYNGHVYIPFGSHGDNGPWHGWVIAYDATTLAQTAVLCLSANGTGNGIWAAGGGMPIDSGGTAGRLYLSTGNGTYSAYPPLSTSTGFGDSLVQLDLANGGLTPSDAFTPFNQAALSSADTDQGSGGILLPPDQQGSFPHILIQVGKEGRILVLNREKMGGYLPGGTYNANILQDIDGQTNGLWSTPAYWNGNVYMWAKGDTAKQFTLNNGVLGTTRSSASTVTSAFPGASFVVSSDGVQNGIAWAVKTDAYTTNGSEVLYAFDANNLATLLYESDTNSRDDAGPANKFVVPVVTNGKVYIGAAYQVDIYGLLAGAPVAATPVITPNGGDFAAAQSVTLTSATSSASLYYTLDGSTPTSISQAYTGPFTLQANTVLRAIASASGYLQSAVGTASFSFGQQTPAVTFLPAGGTYNIKQQVTLAETDSSAVVYYTLDGSTPTTSSTRYTGPITVSSTATINALAMDPALLASNVSSAAYVIEPGAASINYGSGFASVQGLTLNGSTVNSDDSRLQLTNGGLYQAGSMFYSQPVNVQTFTTDFAFQLSSAQADGFTFTIQNMGSTALGSSGGYLGYAGQAPNPGITNSVAVKFDIYNNSGEGTDSTGVYTNGAMPTVPAVNIASSGIQLNSGDSIRAHLTYDGTNLSMTLTDSVTNKTFTLTQAINIPQVVGSNTAYVGFTGGTGGLTASQKILTWTYASQPLASATAAPVFSPTAGSYQATQTVSLTSSTPGAVIHFTTDSTTPTANSTVYTAPILVGSGTTTVQAIATATGFSQSAVSTATYVITPVVTAAPTFGPAAGSYTTAQTVTLADSTKGAVIHYTTNGTTPTATSPTYTAPISVGTGTTTVQAIATATGYSQSAVSTATYVITAGAAAAPTFGPAAGSYTTAQTVTLADSTKGAVIHYTTNGTTPTPTSPTYTAPISVGTGTTTVQAIATATGYSQSSVSTSTYVVTPPPAAAPTFSPAAGTYTTAQTVTLADNTPGATIYYTTNGTTPTTASPVYTAPLQVAATETISAIAVSSGAQPSTVVTSTYTIPNGINYGNGFSSAQGLTLNGSTALSNGVLQITNGGLNQAGSVFSSQPLNIQAFTTDFTFQLSSAKAEGFTFTIQNTGPKALGSSGAYLGYAGLSPNPGITKSIAIKFDFYSDAGEGTDSTGIYVNGAMPTTPAVSLASTGIQLDSGDAMHAHFTYDGTTFSMTLTDTVTGKSASITQSGNIAQIVGANTAYIGFTGSTGSLSAIQKLLTWTFTSGAPAPTAVHADFTASGAQAAKQQESEPQTSAASAAPLSSGAAIPAVPSSAVPSSTAVPEQSHASAGTALNSVTSRVAQEPQLTPAPGPLSGEANVQLLSKTPGAVIHYTLDGSQPTRSSPRYHAPIVVSGTSLTIKAFTSVPGLRDSPVITGTYYFRN
jgi:hypothetical protein